MAAKGGTIGRTLIWIMLGLLIVGLAGFGITGFGGTVTTIGKVGGQEIRANDYARALQQEAGAMSAQIGRNVTVSEAVNSGLDRIVRQRLITTAALDDEAMRVGLSVGDARLAAEVRSMPVFTGVGGQFDRDAYRFTLEQNGFTEAQFETRIRADLARSLLQGAIEGGMRAPDILGRTFFDHVAERRSFNLLRLTEADLESALPEPDDAALAAHHGANEARFTRPEQRRIAYAVMLPEDQLGNVELDEARLRAAYDQRIDDFVQPERRLVERLAFGSEAEAEEARNRIDAGAASFDDLVAERGLAIGDVDLGDVTRAELGGAGETLFALDAPAVAGPLPSPIGPALFRVNGVLMAQEVTFEEAREQLVGEFAMDAARRLIADRIEEIDDLLAGGATLEDLVAEVGMEFGIVDLGPQDNDGLAGYAAFRERAASVGPRDFPEIFMLDDGGIAALRLEEIVPPRLMPLEEVRDEVAASLRAEALRAALSERAEAIRAEVEGGAALATQGVVTVLTDISRDGYVSGAPAGLMSRLFALGAPGETALVAEGDFIAVLELAEIRAADFNEPEAAFLIAAFNAQTAQTMAQDLFTLFAHSVEATAGITLNEAVIQAVHAQMN